MLAELAAAVREGRISPVELVEEALRRIESRDGELNSVIALRAEQALAEARAHDRQGALAGIPVLVKDLEDVAGMRTTFGSTLHANDPEAVEDDRIWAQLKAAGAICVGKTNTPEYAWTGYTSNELHGTTRNPWNTAMSPGGSSGGAGAALAAGLTPIATSSDGGGSVRIPATVCGLVGWKSTFGAVGRSRMPVWPQFSANGVLGATVADVLLEASVIQGPAAGDVYCLPSGVSLEPQLPTKVVAVPTFKSAVDPAIAAAFETTLGVIESELGLPVERIDRVWDTTPDPATAWLLMGSAEMAQALEWAKDRHDQIDPGLKLMLTMGQYVERGAYLDAQRIRFEASRQLEDLIGAGGVLVTPTVNAACWPAEGPFPVEIAGQPIGPLDNVNTMELNLTGQPAVSVPMGIGPEGVPLGLQICASRFRDDLCLGLAAALERAQPWPKIAPGYEPFPVP